MRSPIVGAKIRDLSVQIKMLLIYARAPTDFVARMLGLDVFPHNYSILGDVRK